MSSSESSPKTTDNSCVAIVTKTEFEKKMEEFEKQLSEFEKKIKELEKQLSSVQEALCSSNKNIEDLQSDNKTLKMKNNGLRNDIDTLKERMKNGENYQYPQIVFPTLHSTGFVQYGAGMYHLFIPLFMLMILAFMSLLAIVISVNAK